MFFEYLQHNKSHQAYNVTLSDFKVLVISGFVRKFLMDLNLLEMISTESLSNFHLRYVYHTSIKYFPHESKIQANIAH